MEQYWGSMAQYQEIVWPWPIAIYLFLAGLSAGALIAAILAKWRDNGDADSWDGLVQAGAMIAPPAIMLGLGMLILDLGKPFTFWYLMIYYNVTSVMSLGTLLLSVYTPLTLIFCGIIFKERLVQDDRTAGLARPLLPVLEWLEDRSAALERVLIVMAAGVGIYTGFLISALVGKPLFNTPVLPLLFLVSGMSAGIAACILTGLTAFRDEVKQSSLDYLLALDLWAAPAELFVLFLLFTGMYFAGGNTAAVAAQALTTGVWAWVFWVGVVGIGLILPIVIAVTKLHGQAYKLRTILFNSGIALIGVVLLRFYILYAGQIFY